MVNPAARMSDAAARHHSGQRREVRDEGTQGTWTQRMLWTVAVRKARGTSVPHLCRSTPAITVDWMVQHVSHVVYGVPGAKPRGMV